MGQKYSDCDYSCNFGNHTLRSVNLSSFQLFGFNLLPPATWLATPYSGNADKNNDASYWTTTMFITGLAASMAVNALVTSMIVIKILKAKGVEPTSVERTLGSTVGSKYRHIMFIIIESGVALFAIQLVRFVLEFVSVPVEQSPFLQAAFDIVVVINQMLNVNIIRSSFLLLLFC